MNRYPRFLIALDASRQALDACAYAARMLPPDISRIRLFHLKREGDSPPISETLREGRAHFIHSGFPGESVTVQIQPLVAGVRNDLLQEAVTGGYDGIFAGRNGKGHDGSGIMGSVAAYLVSRLKQTTLILVGGTPETGHVLIGYDDSEGSRHCLDIAGGLFSSQKKALEILNIHRHLNPFSDQFDPINFIFNPDDAFTHHHEIAGAVSTRQSMQEWASAQIRSGNLNDIQTHVIEGYLNRAEGLAETAFKRDFGTVIVGRRGRSRLQEWIAGPMGSDIVNRLPDKAVWIVA